MDKVKDVINAIERYYWSHLFMQVKQLKLKPEKKTGFKLNPELIP